MKKGPWDFRGQCFQSFAYMWNISDVHVLNVILKEIIYITISSSTIPKSTLQFSSMNLQCAFLQKFQCSWDSFVWAQHLEIQVLQWIPLLRNLNVVCIISFFKSNFPKFSNVHILDDEESAWGQMFCPNIFSIIQLFLNLQKIIFLYEALRIEPTAVTIHLTRNTRIYNLMRFSFFPSFFHTENVMPCAFRD